MQYLSSHLQFGFQTRYFHDYFKKDLGELIIIGTAVFMPQNIEPEWRGIDADIWETVFNFDIDSIRWEGADITKMYRTKAILDDTLIGVITKSTYSHLEWVFKDEIASHFGRTIEGCERDVITDLDQHIEYPVIRNSSKAKAA